MQLAIFYSHLQEFWLPFFHAQFALGKGFYSADADTKPFKDDVEGRINHVLRRAPASGGGGGAAPPAVGGSGGGVEFRACRIIGFAELLFFFGNEFTAAELHCYWCNARRLCTRRAHPWTNPARKAATQSHYAATGRWGLGRDVAVGDIAWSGRIPNPKSKGKRTGKGKGKNQEEEG